MARYGKRTVHKNDALEKLRQEFNKLVADVEAIRSAVEEEESPPEALTAQPVHNLE